MLRGKPTWFYCTRTHYKPLYHSLPSSRRDKNSKRTENGANRSCAGCKFYKREDCSSQEFSVRLGTKWAPPQRNCHLGGVVVSVLAIEPKDCGFEPGQGDDGFLRAIKISSTPSSRMGSKAGRFDPRHRQRISPLASVSIPALMPTQPPVQRVPGVLSPGVNRGRDVTLTTRPIQYRGQG
jgi:hypothetical protein